MNIWKLLWPLARYRFGMYLLSGVLASAWSASVCRSAAALAVSRVSASLAVNRAPTSRLAASPFDGLTVVASTGLVRVTALLVA